MTGSRSSRNDAPRTIHDFEQHFGRDDRYVGNITQEVEMTISGSTASLYLKF